MKQIVIYGSSDDLIEVEGDVPGCDEYNVEKAVFVTAGLRIHVKYDDGGCWRIGAVPFAEDVEVAVTDIRLDVADNGYSMRLTASVPDGATITREAV